MFIKFTGAMEADRVDDMSSREGREWNVKMPVRYVSYQHYQTKTTAYHMNNSLLVFPSSVRRDLFL